MGGHVRVGVLDEREIVRAGVVALLHGRDDLAVTAELDSSAALRRWSEELDVLLLDPLLAGGGQLVADVACAQALGAKVLAITDASAGAVLPAVRAAGADGLVLHRAAPGTLAHAVRAVVGTEAWGFAVWGEAAADCLAQDARLSRVERQVLALYAAGVKAEAVARAVGLSASTVTTYVSRIRRKYERVGRAAGSRVDLYRRAVEDGVLPAGEGFAAAG